MGPKRRLTSAESPPEQALPPESREESDDESPLSSEDDGTHDVCLDADDSMFRPPAINRVERLAPPLVTRQSESESVTSMPDGSGGHQDGRTRRSTRQASTRRTTTSHADEDILPSAKGSVKSSSHPAVDGSKSKRLRDDSPELDTRGHDDSPKKKRTSGVPAEKSQQPPPASGVHPRRVILGAEERKDKGKSRGSPGNEAPEERMELDIPPADEAEAEDIRHAIQASLIDVGGPNPNPDGLGSGMSSHALTYSTPTPTLSDTSAVEATSNNPPSTSTTSTFTQANPPPAAETDPVLGGPPTANVSAGVLPEAPSTPSGSTDAAFGLHRSPVIQPGTPSTPGGTSSSSNGTPSPSSRRTFAAARLQISGVQSRPVTSSRSAHDPNEYRVRELPARCQVDNPHLQDAMLREFYQNLPNLIIGAFIAWSQLRGSGQFPFSHWGDVAPSMDFENALAFINFTANGHFVNPSRASPLLTRAVRTTPNGFRMNLYVETQPAILMSTIYVRQSHLPSPPARGLCQHLIAGVGHTQEWERQVSFICMVFGQPSLRAQLSADVLSYTTRSDTSQNYTSPLGRFSSTQSPTIRVSTRSYQGSSDNMALSFNDQVPVYDARTTPVDMSNMDTLFNLPRFEGEVPANSFAAVGYTTNAYLSNRDNNWHVSCNIHFVVVVGTPAEDVDGEGAPVPLDD